MARPLTRSGALSTPRARALAGWLAALVIVIAIAFVVGRLGTSSETGIGPSPSEGTAGGRSVLPIVFGTELDAVTGQVAGNTRVDRFAAGDAFAYSVVTEAAPSNGEIYVEVVRSGGGGETVQEPSLQRIPAGTTLIAFQVPADALLADFGPGDYVMRIYAAPGGSLLAEGRFRLVGPAPS